MILKINAGSYTARGGATATEKYFLMTTSFLIERGEEITMQELQTRVKEYYSNSKLNLIMEEINKRSK